MAEADALRWSLLSETYGGMGGARFAWSFAARHQGE
jgi:hypothetical protein